MQEVYGAQAEKYWGVSGDRLPGGRLALGLWNNILIGLYSNGSE